MPLYIYNTYGYSDAFMHLQNIYIYIYIYICVCMYVCVYMCVYINIHMSIREYAYIPCNNNIY